MDMDNNTLSDVIKNTSGEPLMRLRRRPQLTSLQITDQQKQTIDTAYSLYTRTGNTGNRGDFVEFLAADYLKKRGGIVGAPQMPSATAPEV